MASSRCSARRRRSRMCSARGSRWRQQDIQSELGLDELQFGVVFSAWSAGYAAAQIPSGWLADRWGSRRALALFALLWSVATGLLAASRGYWSLLGFWTLMGVAQAGIFPCSARAISRAFVSAAARLGERAARQFHGDRRRARTEANGAIAARGHFVALDFRALRGARRPLGRRLLPLVSGGASDRPGAAAPDPSAARESEADALRLIAGSPSMWLLCAQQFLRAAAMIFLPHVVPDLSSGEPRRDAAAGGQSHHARGRRRRGRRAARRLWLRQSAGADRQPPPEPPGHRRRRHERLRRAHRLRGFIPDITLSVSIIGSGRVLRVVRRRQRLRGRHGLRRPARRDRFQHHEYLRQHRRRGLSPRRRLARGAPRKLEPDAVRFRGNLRRRCCLLGAAESEEAALRRRSDPEFLPTNRTNRNEWRRPPIRCIHRSSLFV